MDEWRPCYRKDDRTTRDRRVTQPILEIRLREAARAYAAEGNNPQPEGENWAAWYAAYICRWLPEVQPVRVEW